MTTPVPTFEFPANDADESEGLGDAGIETFRDAPYASCAREAGQNSRDAKADSLAKPVRVTFDVLRVKPDDFPAHDRLASALRSCLEQARDEKEKDFFTNALRVNSCATIPVLRIADYNTTGLTGPPDKTGTPFNSLLKSKGISKKDSDTSGGSFGIGKNASIAVSELQTVFYSTCYIEPGNNEQTFAAQGKVVLVSHEGSDGGPRRATGYWGNPDKFRAVTDSANVPDWLRRDEVGTSIFCMGFRESEHWAKRMTCSLISNFFVAVYRCQMEFEVESSPINRNTLGRLLASADFLQAVETTAHKTDLEFAKDLYRCLTSGHAHEEVISVVGLGKVQVRILTEKGMPSRIGFVRNGMLITDNLTHFGQPLARFPGARDFIAIVEPVDDEAGKLLKQLENPAHNSFSAERLSDPTKRQAAKKAINLLVKQLREVIIKHAGIQYEESSSVDELAHLFGEAGGTEGGGHESDPERYTYKVVRHEPPRQSQAAAGGSQFDGGAGISKKKSGVVRRGGGSGTRGEGTRDARNEPQRVNLLNVRNRISAGSDKRSIFFSADGSGLVQLTILATGVNASEQLYIKATNEGKLLRGSVMVPVVSGARHQVDVVFDEPYDGPIEVGAVMIDEKVGL